MTRAEALAGGAARLRAAGVPEASGDARRLLAHALGLAPGRLTLILREPLPPGAAVVYEALLARRARREPVAQIIGKRVFWGRDFRVTADVLDPRPETEVLVEAALREPFERLLDLGTGSGCVLVTLLAERPASRGVGIDAAPAALEVARGNAVAQGVADRAAFLRSDWFEAVEGSFDLIVANPPYIALDEMAGLDPEVRDWEPWQALTDGGDGLGAYRAILAGTGRHLTPGGRLLLETGPTQAASVAALGQAAGLGEATILRDLDGRDRVAMFRGPDATI